MKLFNEDEETDAVLMVGEIGGSDEEDCARWVRDNMKKPLVGFIAGMTAPPGKRMGHAGAVISGGRGTAQEKLAVMEECGIKVTRNPAEMGKTSNRLCDNTLSAYCRYCYVATYLQRSRGSLAMTFFSLIAAFLLEHWRPIGDRNPVVSAFLSYADSLERYFNTGERRHGIAAWAAALVPVLGLLGVDLLFAGQLQSRYWRGRGM